MSIPKIGTSRIGGLSRRSFMVASAAATTGAPSAGSAAPVRAAKATPSDGYAVEKLDGVTFTRPAVITNRWLPMSPGMRYVYEGTAVEDNGKLVQHRIVLNITDLVKVIGGVANLVSYDLDYSDNELKEAELAFFAQDDAGNVWHFGQYPEEYEDGRFKKAPAWIHGYEGAHAGIMMKAAPSLGTPDYSQGYGPAVDWTDRGTTFQMGQSIVVPHGTYSDVMVVRETARSEVDAFQLKYYARDVGNVKVGWMGEGEKTREAVELVKVERLGSKALADIRAKALALEKSAYRHSRTVYAPTTPSKVRTTS